jgi:hypothetical protein
MYEHYHQAVAGVVSAGICLLPFTRALGIGPMTHGAVLLKQLRTGRDQVGVVPAFCGMGCYADLVVRPLA